MVMGLHVTYSRVDPEAFLGIRRYGTQDQCYSFWEVSFAGYVGIDGSQVR
jgi:hypothetical protein